MTPAGCVYFSWTATSRAVTSSKMASNQTVFPSSRKPPETQPKLVCRHLDAQTNAKSMLINNEAHGGARKPNFQGTNWSELSHQRKRQQRNVACRYHHHSHSCHS